jgi:hypothetical protein
VRAAVGGAVPDEVSRSCHAATGGNPFYLDAIVAEFGETLLSASAADVDAVAPERIARLA